MLVADGKILEVKPDIKTSDAKVIEAKGKIVVPGLIDIHTHLREPGHEEEETIESGTKAAVWRNNYDILHAEHPSAARQCAGGRVRSQ